MNADLVPALDPTPLPGPGWLFHVLLVVTFVVHALFLNLALGGTLLAAVGQLAAGGRTGDYRAVLARRLMGVNTFAISLAITTGVAPLLFVQLLYQQYFYTAGILIAWAWLLFVVLLLVGYYAAYVYKYRGAPERGGGGSVWLVVAAAMFLVIAMIHVAVHLVHAQPDKWALFADRPWAVLSDRVYFVRLLHFVLAAIGFTALVAAWWAVRQVRAGRDVELNTSIAGFAWKWVLWTTALQLVDGFVLVAVLPQPVLLGLMRGGAATLVPLTASILLAIGLLMMVARTSDPVEKPGLVGGTLGAMLLTIGVMSITRHQVRDLYLAPYMSGDEVATAPQWGNFVLFALLLAASLATVGYMVRRTACEPASGDETA